MTPRIEILVGMIASGKSTYAHKRADEGAMVICHDDLTEMLHARYRYEQEKRELYRKLEESIAFNCLSAGLDVIVDRTHLTRESRQRWIRWARDYESLNTFEGKGPTIPVVAVEFPFSWASIHAERRYESDSRGRPFDEWLRVAMHHYEQTAREPLCTDEGFERIIAIRPDDILEWSKRP